MTSKASSRTVHPSHDHSLALYRRIAVTFVVFVALILSLVLYLSLVRATVVVIPVEELVTTEFVLDAVEQPSAASQIRGRVVTGPIGKQQTVQVASALETRRPVQARGTVLLKNDSASPQSLVRTTRLMSADGKLMRLDEAVTVPANGTRTVAVYADKAGKEGELPAGRFTIPGLPEKRQTEVYGVLEQPLQNGEVVFAVLSQDEIDRATEELKRALEEDAKVMLRAQIGDTFPGEVFASEVVKQTVNAKAGDEVSSFDLSLQLQVTGVYYDATSVARLAEDRLYQALGQGREFLDVNRDGLHVSIEKIDTLGKRANLHVYFDGKAIPSRTSQLLDASQFVGKNESEIRALLLSYPVIKDVRVEVWPSFMKTVPRLSDQIRVVIEGKP